MPGSRFKPGTNSVEMTFGSILIAQIESFLGSHWVHPATGFARCVNLVSVAKNLPNKDESFFHELKK